MSSEVEIPKLIDKAEDDGSKDMAATEIITRLIFSNRDTPGLTVTGGARPLTFS